MRSYSKLFEFIPKKEQEKRRAKYNKKMLPFGDEQRKYELSVLRECMDTSLSDEETMYFLFCVKECLYQDDEEFEEAVDFYKTSGLGSALTERDWASFEILASMEQSCSRLEEFPSSAEVLNLVIDKLKSS